MNIYDEDMTERKKNFQRKDKKFAKNEKVRKFDKAIKTWGKIEMLNPWTKTERNNKEMWTKENVYK